MTTSSNGNMAGKSPYPILTDAIGLNAGEVMIPVQDGEMFAHRAMPASKTQLPIVLVVQEIFGVHEYNRDVCRRFAKAGYLALPQSCTRGKATHQRIRTFRC